MDNLPESSSVSSLGKDWLIAIYKGDCLKIEYLLIKDQRLINIYPRSPSCKDSKVFAAHFGGWRGCSALHVAVKRGWPFLVDMIVNLFKVVSQEKADGLTIAGLEELLLALDTDYNLDALALAVVNGNELIVKILAQASLHCKGNPYRVPSLPGVTAAISRVAHEVDRTSTGFSSDGRLTNKLWSIICEIVGPELGHHVKKYDKNLSYNFLPVRFFLPHHWISTGTPRKSLMLLTAMKGKLDTDDPESALLEYIFSLKDGRGKTLAHVATLANLTHVLGLKTNRRELFLDAGDGAGRTVAHGFVDQLKDLTTDTLSFYHYFPHVGFRVNDFTRKCIWKNQGLYTYFDLDALCTRNGYTGHHFENLTKAVAPDESTTIGPKNVRILHESSPLHYVALHDTFTTFTTLIQLINYMEPSEGSAELDWNVRCIMRQRSMNSMLETVFPNYFLESAGDCSWSILQVAAMSGNRSVLRALLKVHEAYDGTRVNNSTSHAEFDLWYDNGPLSVLFIAAAVGDPYIIQSLLVSRKLDPLMVTTRSKDTALHFAAHADYNGPLLQPTLLDLVNVPHRPGIRMPHRFRFAGKSVQESEYRKVLDSKRKGCINLLLQAGIDIWHQNAEENMADPGEDASPDFCLWWYEKLAKETLELKIGLNSAAKAVSVTAALVATASFVGPFQPPLGYGASKFGSSDMIQVDNPSVRIFMVCDTLALYFALVAIMLSLMPLLPLLQDSLLDELSHVRKMVIAAVASLIVSVVLFLVGFAAGSVAVIPNTGSWNSGGLTISTVVIGGTFCLFALYISLLRLARQMFPSNTWLRRNFRRLTCLK